MQMFGRAYTAASELLALPGRGLSAFRHKSIGGARSKNASQDWSAGLMRRLRPSLVTSTWRTLGGKATGFGNRTAWLRLVVKTVERATWTFRKWYIPKGYTHPCRLVNTDRRDWIEERFNALDRTFDVSIERAA